jgi:bifunctional DNA-binding transcriptional regulator/antitoxin component of YhaV-PrlF toxin-antitoxin module
MSVAMDIETGKLSIYDAKGRTYLPDNIKDAMGVEKGDKIKVVVEDGELRGEKVAEDEDK